MGGVFVAALFAALTLVVPASPVSAEFHERCPAVFTTQDICYLQDVTEHELDDAVGDRFINSSYRSETVTVRILEGSLAGTETEMDVSLLLVYPIDGCGSFGGLANAEAATGIASAQACSQPLRFSIGDQNYCIQDDNAHSWQLCSTSPDTPEPTPDTESVPNAHPFKPELQYRTWENSCLGSPPGVYGTAMHPVVCWGDYVGGDIGGAVDPWNVGEWITFTDCTRARCVTYGN